MKLRVLEICKVRGITQKALAEKIEMSEVGLSKSINGNPTLETLSKISSALEVDITELFQDNRPAENKIQCPNCGSILKINFERS